MCNRKLYLASVIIVLIAALNWGAIALTNTNVVMSTNMALFNPENAVMATKFVYLVVTLAALHVIYVDWDKLLCRTA